MVTEDIIFTCKFLNPVKILTDCRVINRIEQIYGVGVETGLIVRKYKILVLLHGEQELPAILDFVCLVYDRVSEADSGDCLHERYGLFLQVPVRVDKYCDMVIVAQADEVGRYGFPLVVHNLSAEHITLLMQCVDACRPADCDPFNLYALVLVEPDRILVQVGECLLGVISEFFKPFGENPSNVAVYDLVYFKIGVNLLAYRVDRRQSDSLDSLRHLFLGLLSYCASLW